MPTIIADSAQPCRQNRWFSFSVLLVAFCALTLTSACDDDSSDDNNSGTQNPGTEECRGELQASIAIDQNTATEFTATQAVGTDYGVQTQFSASSNTQPFVVQLMLFRSLDNIEIGKSYQIQDQSVVQTSELQAAARLTAESGIKQFTSISGSVTITDIHTKADGGGVQLQLVSGTMTTTLSGVLNTSETATISNCTFKDVVISSF